MQGRHHGHASRIVAKKQFGQNFLVDADVLARIVDAITSVGIRELIEVGPGTGVLTAALLPHADHLTSVEFDRDLIPFLEKSFFNEPKFTLVQGDILLWSPEARSQKPEARNQIQETKSKDQKDGNAPLPPQADKGGRGDSELTTAHSPQPLAPYHLVGNIPYNLTTKLFEKILSWENKPAAITFLIQKEVAEKVTQKGGKNSPLALAAEILGEAKLLFDVPPTAFQPQPKVMSSVIQILMKQEGRGTKEEKEQPTSCFLSPTSCLALYDFAHRLFRNPRKTLLNNLLAMMPKEKAVELMEKTGLDPMVRPERLSLDQMSRLEGMLK